MPPTQMRQRAPTQTAASRAAMHARPITGQAAVPPTAGNQPGPRPMGPGISRPPALQPVCSLDLAPWAQASVDLQPVCSLATPRSDFYFKIEISRSSIIIRVLIYRALLRSVTKL
eukprot:TRINITY_DN33781_c0_g1_i1.p2 TRINITY_DN33781_c0_g1~~TRINITY_DN33781_c0_g1_i1.p2  ORF type:complete len:115 (-),score=13.78 TRINITY_DN33781_c0_g1_i1:168-512(-)